jgi:hypothetical protein
LFNFRIKLNTQFPLMIAVTAGSPTGVANDANNPSALGVAVIPETVLGVLERTLYPLTSLATE